MLCESVIGTVTDSEYILGKKGPVDDMNTSLCTVFQINEVDKLSKAEKLVMYMSLPLFKQINTLYMDNWFTIISLTQFFPKSINVCGTMRQNRVPSTVRALDVGVGQSRFVRGDNSLFCKFRDKRDVSMVSMVHGEVLHHVRERGGRKVLTHSRRHFQYIHVSVDWTFFKCLLFMTSYNTSYLGLRPVPSKYIEGVERVDQVKIHFIFMSAFVHHLFSIYIILH